MPSRFFTLLSGRNVPLIVHPRESESSSTINAKTIADFTRVVEQTGKLMTRRVRVGTKLEEQFDEPVELPDFLRQLFELAEAVNHKEHFLAGFDRLVSRDFAGSDFADLRIPSGFKLSYKLLLGQAKSGRENGNDH